jgi:transcriptional regulator with XRE-family HTH domain
MIAFPEMDQRLKRIGKDRLWLAAQTPYTANTIRQALTPRGSAKSARLQEVLSGVIEMQEQRILSATAEMQQGLSGGRTTLEQPGPAGGVALTGAPRAKHPSTSIHPHGPISPQEIRRFRKLNGLSQDELGRRCGVRKSSVSEWELGKSSPSGAAALLLEGYLRDERNPLPLTKRQELLLDEAVRRGSFDSREEFLAACLSLLIRNNGPAKRVGDAPRSVWKTS